MGKILKCHFLKMYQRLMAETKVIKHFSYNQNFVPCEISAIALRLYTCTQLCNLYMFSPLKLLKQFSLDFVWGLPSKGYCQFVQIFFSRTKKALGLNLGILHRCLKIFQVNSNDDGRLTFDLFTTRSKLRFYRFVWGKVEKKCCCLSVFFFFVCFFVCFFVVVFFFFFLLFFFCFFFVFFCFVFLFFFNMYLRLMAETYNV